MPRVVDHVPLTDPVQQWWDLHDLGGEDRREAADRLRRGIIDGSVAIVHDGATNHVGKSLRRDDGGRVAIADISDAMNTMRASNDYRLIGGVAVPLHVQHLGLDLPLRTTGDADFGIPSHLLRDRERAIEALGYAEVAGNRWERPIDHRRVAAADLLSPPTPLARVTPDTLVTQ